MTETTPTNRRSLSALLFPGQGSQHDQMRALVEAERPDLLELACKTVGSDPFVRLREGTRFVQPAIFCSTLAWWERLGRPRAPILAGHSLGELTALVIAGSIDAADALRLVVLRGRITQRIGDRQGDGGMLAIIGAPAGGAAQLAVRSGVSLASENSAAQSVLSGRGERLDAAGAMAKAEGLKSVRLSVNGAFHSPAMAEAVPAFRAALANVAIHPPRVTTYSGVTAQPFGDVRDLLARSLTEGVRWRDTLDAIHAAGVRRVTEIGPGSVLTKLVRRSYPDIEATAADVPTRVELRAAA